MTYTDTSVTPGTTYFYRVRAINSAGTSGYSTEVGANVPTPPIAPSAAQATLVTATEIDLAWQDNSNNEDGFYLFPRNRAQRLHPDRYSAAEHHQL